MIMVPWKITSMRYSKKKVVEMLIFGRYNKALLVIMVLELFAFNNSLAMVISDTKNQTDKKQPEQPYFKQEFNHFRMRSIWIQPG